MIRATLLTALLAAPAMAQTPPDDDMIADETVMAPAGTPPPPAPKVDYADRIWGADAMAGPRSKLFQDHGGGRFAQIMVNQLEARLHDGADSYRWKAEGWFGGDRDRLVVESEGEGDFGGDFGEGEAQLLYSRAVGPYFNVQGGVRQDFGEGPSRSYATLGFEGLAPWWFEVEGRLFVSDKGDVFARLEASYDQRITQRLILQPQLEANFAAQSVPEQNLGSGLTDIDLGLRLRYEIRRAFAPYVGIAHERRFGDTGKFGPTALPRSQTSLALGLRLWF